MENIRDPSTHITQISSYNVEIHVENETGWDPLPSNVQVGLLECLLHHLPLIMAEWYAAFLTAQLHVHQLRALHTRRERDLPRHSPVQTGRGVG